MFGGISVGLMFLMRYNITVSILRMVNHTHLYLEEHPGKTMEDFLAEGNTPGGEFNWNNEIQQMIMSWYMVAYTLPQVPATKLGTMLGGRLATSISLGTCAISTLLTPMSAYWGWQWVIVLRLINGLGGSAVLPMLLSLVENWMPYEEISMGLTIAQTLTAVLSATNPLIAGYLSSIHWSLSFYVPGAVALVFCLLWAILITDHPEDNYFISNKELGYICGCHKDDSSIKKNELPSNSQQAVNNSATTDNYSYKPDSWTQIFKVPSFYAYIFMWCFYCSSYSSFTFILPTYLRQFLKVHVAQNGIYCFMIQSGCIISALWPHPFLWVLQRKLGLGLTASRRLTHVVLCSMVAFTWMYVGFFHEFQLILLFLNRCAHNSNDIVVTGSLMTNYAKAGLSSLVFSMVNTVGNLSVVFASTFIGWFLDYTGQSRKGWCWIFNGLGVSQLIMLLTFLLVVSSDPIKFKNKTKTKKNNLEVGSAQLPAHKSSEGMLNNFEKLRANQGNKNLDDNNNSNNNIDMTGVSIDGRDKVNESKQI